MTTTEFSEWFTGHAGRFTLIHERLAKLPMKPRYEGDVTQKNVIDAWRDALRDVAYADARSVSEAMFRGEEESPKSFDEHPKAVRRLCMRIKNATAATTPQRRTVIIDGEPVYRCPICHDQGFVLVYRSDSVRAMQDGKARHPTLAPEGKTYVRECIAGCSCRCDQRLARAEVYSPDKHIRCTETTTDGQFRELQEAVSAGVSGSLPAGASAFNAGAWDK